MRKIVNEPIKYVMKKYVDLYIICCIPVFPFCLAVNILIYLYMGCDRNVGGFGNCMLFITIILLLICFAVFRYSLKLYIRKNAEKYSLLVTLGISNGDFWKILVKDYCPGFILLLVLSAIFSNVISNVILIAVFKVISYDIILLSTKMMVLLLLLFSFGMFGTLLILKWKQWRKDLICYFEKLDNGSEAVHRFRITYGIKAGLAIFCFLLSFVMLYDYTVGKLFIAVILHLAGVYFLLQLNGRLIKKILCLNKKRYYQKLLIWNDFIFDYRINGNLIYSIYAVNILLVFIFGGLFASDWPKDYFYSSIQAIIAVAGLSVILEEQIIILERMILDVNTAREQRNILFQLGMENREYLKFIQSKIKHMTVFPGMLASVMGTLFFMSDYIYQENISALSDLWSFTLVKYIVAILVFWFIQHIGYFFIKERVMNYLEQSEAAIYYGQEG